MHCHHYMMHTYFFAHIFPIKFPWVLFDLGMRKSYEFVIVHFYVPPLTKSESLIYLDVRHWLHLASAYNCLQAHLLLTWFFLHEFVVKVYVCGRALKAITSTMSWNHLAWQTWQQTWTSVTWGEWQGTRWPAWDPSHKDPS